MKKKKLHLQFFASDNPTEEPPAQASPPIRMTWEEIMQDPEYGRQFEETVRARLDEQRFRDTEETPEYFAELETQATALKHRFPDFDLQTELKNPAFARMTAPGKGNMRVEDAYYAIHRHEIHTAAMQETARKTAEMVANAIQSGSRRPEEAGASSQAPSVTAFDYAKAGREQREAFKKELRLKMARGEKVYPGR